MRMNGVDRNTTCGGQMRMRSLLLIGASTITMMATPALAQDAASASATAAQAAPGDPNTAEDIIVTGIRGSLQRNLDIKREAAGVVDAISAEDIGKFPDSNVAASLQRLPGVSIQRDGARGEATGITVRGFGGDFNETLYDGRRVSTATGGRSVDFSTVGSDFVGQLNVMKTPDVTLAANSIGATVNVLFPKPFDHPGLRLVASASGSWQSDAKKVVPTGGILFSDTFADDTFGILADVAYARHDTQTNNVYINGFNFGYYAPCQLAGSTAATCAPTSELANSQGVPTNPNNLTSVRGAFEQQYGAQQYYTKDERVDGRLALQWHPSDSVLVTLDDNFSRQRVKVDSFGFGIWFNQGSLRNVTLDSKGVPTNFTQAGSQTDFVAATTNNVLQTNQTGLNVKWNVSDKFTVEADGSYSKSWRNPEGQVSNENADVGYGFGIGPSLGIVVGGDSSNTLPTLNNYGVNGDESRWADTSVIGSHVTVRSSNKNTDVVKQGRLTGEWKQDDFSLKFGGQYVVDQFSLQSSDTFTNNFWQAYAGYGPASGGTGGVALPASLFQGTVSTANFLPGYSGVLPSPLLRFTAADYQAYLTSLGNPQTKNIPGFNYGSVNGFTGAFDLALSPGSVQLITEKTWSAFLRASFETEIAGMPFHFNAGAREEVTHISSTGIGRFPTHIASSTSDPTLLTVDTYTANQNVTTKSDYAYLLPSIDMKLNITSKLDLRFDASRTLTRPNLSYLTPVLNVGSGQRVGALTATGGNPTLKPYLADNFDFAVEWYYQRNSYAAIDFFVKNVTNFIVQGTTRQTINNVIDPSTGQPAQFSVSARVNGSDATVRGVEIAWQQVFGESGFGFQANGTFVDTNRPYDPDNFGSAFAVTGLANSANFVGFYDKHGFQARVAVNWRDEYLLQFGQAQNTGKFGAEPTFVNASTQIDFSTSYDINKNISIFAEVLNLTDETYSTHGRYGNQLLSAYGYGRRITAGVHFRL